MIRFAEAEGAVLVLAPDGRPLGRLAATAQAPGNDAFWRPEPLAAVAAEGSEGPEVSGTSGGAVVLRFAGGVPRVEATLVLRHRGDGAWHGAWSARGQGRRIVRLTFALDPARGPGEAFSPAVLYGDNRAAATSRATFPMLSDAADGRPDATPWIAPEWRYRTDRSSHAFAALCAADWAVAIGGSDVVRDAAGRAVEKTGLSASNRALSQVSFSLGFANAPYTYSAIPGRNAVPRPEGYAPLDGDGASAPVLFAAVEAPPDAARPLLLRAAYRFAAEAGMRRRPDDGTEPGPRDLDEAIGAIAGALAAYAYVPDEQDFRVTVPWRPGEPPANGDFNTAWAGGLRAAAPLLSAARALGRSDWATCAVAVLDRTAEEARSPRSGLLFEHRDGTTGVRSTRGWWSPCLDRPGHSGYVNGQACYFLLEAYRAEQALGHAHPAWRATAEAVLRSALERRLPDGRFGAVLSEEDGSPIETKGFAGCWFVPALASMGLIDPDPLWPEAAAQGLRAYRAEVRGFRAAGCPHDAFGSPDEEGVLAFLRGADLLHARTGDDAWLALVDEGIDYEESWRYAYDPVIEVEPLRAMDWSAAGGAVTSVNNAHVHPMGVSVLDLLRRHASRDASGLRAARYRDAARWALRAYLREDGDYGWGRRGMINERFCPSDALLLERFPDGSPASTWFTAHSWASGAVLEGLVALRRDLISEGRKTT